MQIVRAHVAQALLLELKGRMDLIAAMQYEKAVAEALAAGERQLVVDLAALDFIGSAGLRSLLTTAKKIRELKGVLRFCNVTGAVKDVFAASGFDSILSIFPSVKEALPDPSEGPPRV